MNGTKHLSVCTLIFLLGSGYLRAYAQASEAAASPKQINSSPGQPAAEKSVLAEPSKQAAKPEAVAADFCRCVGEGDSSMSKRIEKALAIPLHQTGLDYVDQPLEDVVAQLADEYGIPIHINTPALKKVGISSDTKINLSIHNVTLRSALRLMLRSHQLTYVIEDEVLVITTPEDAESDLKLCVYDVRRLVGDNGDLAQLIDIIDIIRSCVLADTWDKDGKGIADIRPFRPGLLVITQTHSAHDEIRKLLTTLDEMRHDHHGHAGSAPAKAPTSGSAERRRAPSPAKTSPPRKDGPSQPARSAAELDPFGD